MSVPTELPDIGSTAQRLRQNPRFDPVAAGIGPEEYFVWTRFDGATTLRDLILMTGFATPRAIDIVRKLRTLGAVLLPNERPEAVASRLRPAAPAAGSRTPPGGVRARPMTEDAPTIQRHPSAPLADDERPTARTPSSALRGVPPTSGTRGVPPTPGMATRGVPPTSGAAGDHDDDRATTRVAASALREVRATPAGARAGASPAVPSPAVPSPAVPRTSGTVPRTSGTGAIPESSLEPLTPDERQAMSEEVDLAPEDRRRILAMHRSVRAADALSVLGVSDPTDHKGIKRAYFALSKEFHPDRFYGRRTGSFGARLTEIFEAISRAYAELSGDGPRRARGASGGGSSTAQPPTEHAADVFERACQAEVSGDLAGAMRLFAAALRLDASARYLRRAARCALAANEVRVAVEYARKAANLDPNDPSTARLLAAAYRADGRLADAEEVLVLALMIKTENDQLSHEIQADLAEVRRLAAR